MDSRRSYRDLIRGSLDIHGWARVDELIAKTTQFPLSEALIRLVVETNDKQRFALNDDATQIRANQGHSIDVDLKLPAKTPPPILVHGTATRFIDAIRAQGLQKQNRHHVHLTESESVAESVGSRYGKVHVLRVHSAEMANRGYAFFLSANGVWLVDSVPPEFIDF